MLIKNANSVIIYSPTWCLHPYDFIPFVERKGDIQHNVHAALLNKIKVNWDAHS